RLLVLNANTLAQTEDKVRPATFRRLTHPTTPEYQIRQRGAAWRSEMVASCLDDLGSVVLDGGTLPSASAWRTLAEVRVPTSYSLAEHGGSVICCRATPSQKAAIVSLVKEKRSRWQTLAIATAPTITAAAICQWHFLSTIRLMRVQSMVIYFVPHLVIVNSDCDIWSFGDIVVSAGVITAVAHNALELRGWTGIHLVLPLLAVQSLPGSDFALVLNVICTNCMHPDNPITSSSAASPPRQFWLPQLLIPFLALMARLSAMRLQSLHPSPDESAPAAADSAEVVSGTAAVDVARRLDAFSQARSALRRLSVAWLVAEAAAAACQSGIPWRIRHLKEEELADRSESASAVDIRAGSGRSRREFDSGSRHHKRSRSLGASQRIRDHL
uniref:PhoLip_ATPase_C domain-containing protein n=1 Tax=Macrostomum lignano TaxID=282301 RepID=A0A1I8FBF8_9PLAT